MLKVNINGWHTTYACVCPLFRGNTTENIDLYVQISKIIWLELVFLGYVSFVGLSTHQI